MIVHHHQFLLLDPLSIAGGKKYGRSREKGENIRRRGPPSSFPLSSTSIFREEKYEGGGREKEGRTRKDMMISGGGRRAVDKKNIVVAVLTTQKVLFSRPGMMAGREAAGRTEAPPRIEEELSDHLSGRAEDGGEDKMKFGTRAACEGGGGG